MKSDTTNQYLNAGWQVLGELELPASASVENILSAWLTKILYPLSLQAEVRNKIIISAQVAAIHAIQSETVFKDQSFHVTVFIPSGHESKIQAWGFFHIEKIENPADDLNFRILVIEFYLYGEED